MFRMATRSAWMPTLKLVVLLAACLALAAGCSKKKPPAQPLKLEGVWLGNSDGSKLVIRPKGRFALHPADQAGKKIRGAFRQGGGKAIFRNAPDSQVCVGVEGIYTPRLEAGKLTLEVVKDECSSRRKIMTSGFKRAPQQMKEPQETTE